MPTVLDATVVNSAYDTSGNGGRKLVRLSNGWLVAGAKNGTTMINLYVSKDNGATWSRLCYSNTTNAQDFSLVANGTKVYLMWVSAVSSFLVNFNVIDATTVADTDIYASRNSSIESAQTAFSGVSMVMNESGTELHAAWASKNSTYANSFNIRYAKLAINADGSASLVGAVQQITTDNNTNVNHKNPTLTLRSDGKPYIIWEMSNGTSAYMILGQWFNGTAWQVSNVTIYNGSTYAQSSPSAIFVPQSVNGLANGRIWVAWHGTDATDTSANNIRVSYSDDGGVTWSAMQKLTSGNTATQDSATITANKTGNVFIIWNGIVNTRPNIRKISYNGTWGAIVNVTNNTVSPATSTFPSALFDLSVNFTEPLFTYKDQAKVGFYGTWTVTTISVAQGSIGQKTDKANLLTYTITTDGTMSQITEKVNGVTIGTKTATSGEVLIAGLTQEQWDAVRFGKYADATGGQNTLTVEMGSEKWTYTFDKRPATDSDILSAVKAVKDSQEVYIPAVKAKLASAVRNKGGSVNDADSFEVIESAVKGIVATKKANGTVTSSSTTLQFTGGNGGSNGVYHLTVTGLSFTPSLIFLYSSNGLNSTSYNSSIPVAKIEYVQNREVSAPSVATFKLDGTNAYVNGTGFRLPTPNANMTYSYIAIE